MKRRMFCGALMICVLSISAYSTLYEITPGEYFGSKSLGFGDELHMTGGWGEDINMSGNSLANIYATDAGKQILNINAGSNSTLNIYGGTIGEVELVNTNTTVIKGGSIGALISAQKVTGEGGIVIPMTTLYVLSGWSYNNTTMILTGQWMDSTPFSIQLEDKYGISTFNNLNIIPEPCSLILFGLAGLVCHTQMH